MISGKSARPMIRGRGRVGDPSSRIYTVCLLIARAPTVLMIYPWRMAFNLEAGELRRHLSSIADYKRLHPLRPHGTNRTFRAQNYFDVAQSCNDRDDCSTALAKSYNDPAPPRFPLFLPVYISRNVATRTRTRKYVMGRRLDLIVVDEIIL